MDGNRTGKLLDFVACDEHGNAFEQRERSPHVALRYAARAYAGLDRRMEEADALMRWLARSAHAFGLTDAEAPEDGKIAQPEHKLGVTPGTWREVGRSLEAACRRAPHGQTSQAELWAAAVAKALAFDALDAGILALALHYTFDQHTEKLFDTLSMAQGRRSRLSPNAPLFALLLGVPVEQAQARLAPAARLQASGLLIVDEDDDMRPLPRLRALVSRDAAPGPDLAGQLLGGAAPEPLAWSSFAHLGREADTAAALLRAALDAREPGINILLYGPPGTGKTSFAASLAAHVGAPLRPVTEADEDGQEPDRRERLSGLRLAQQLLPPGAAVLLFDEAEDLFGGCLDRHGNAGRGSRVFMHRLIERTPAPVIWTANDIQALGPAVLRRMTLCLELALPSLAARTRLWQEMGEAEGVALGEGEAAGLARLVPAAPAVARTALRGRAAGRGRGGHGAADRRRHRAGRARRGAAAARAGGRRPLRPGPGQRRLRPRRPRSPAGPARRDAAAVVAAVRAAGDGQKRVGAPPRGAHGAAGGAEAGVRPAELLRRRHGGQHRPRLRRGAGRRRVPGVRRGPTACCSTAPARREAGRSARSTRC